MSEPTAPATTPEPRVGIWIDERPSTATTTTYLDALHSLNLGVVAIMVSGNQGFSLDWAPAWSTDQLQAVSKTFHDWGIQVVLTCWPAPNRGYIDNMISGTSQHPGMKDLVAAAGAQGFEVDVEGNWSKKNLHDFSDLAQAGSYLHEQMRAAAPDASLQLTTFPYDNELSGQSTVSQYMDVIVPQAYSTNPAAGTKKEVKWGDPLGPGNMQVLCHNRASAIKPVNGKPLDVVFGLAAYDQQFTDHDPAIHKTPDEAMQAALDAATYYCTEVRYWSSHHAIGTNHYDYAAEFMTGI